MTIQRISWYRTSLTIIAILLGLSLGLANIASANDKPDPRTTDPDGVVTSSEDGINTIAVDEWTAEEMRNATPYPMPQNIGRTTLPGLDTATPDGPAEVMPGTLPETENTDDIGLFSTGEVSSYSAYPYSAVGKIFFRQNGGSFVCSGAVIKSNEIWTAGHCVHSGNGSNSGWSTNVVFVPQYRDGSAPCGQWNVSQLATTTDWYTNGQARGGLDQDYAKGLVSNPNTGCTGILGFAFNQSYSQQYLSVGYPAQSPYSGGRMIFCNEPLLRTDSGSPRTYGISCPMNGGASGGPFIINNNALNGNNSYIYPGANQLYSPYFDSNAKSFYDYRF
ncbi:MAG: hypothetical protein GFH27_549291n60 [Chloroflexi bacterium AL-W]|nr:hypothetical protein [Chloroflexi bacterium AL-N1]NOK67473.1 hypothetical protein [Chloroflexi bacterium AL-N10]NOK75035.1 hypothetical protein [Chloroflexi bacterium AL-N5]NOK81822.1 hypothetical protein [Chloroflexi bacterium AL-W]NOK89668.1 hypothetical protein [Chloroflexi bacterium AL-N15]